MTLVRALGAALTRVALIPIGIAPAAAEIAPCRPWCIHYGGIGGGGGGTNCGFISLEQCRQTVQGSDVCLPNPACLPPSGQGGRQGDSGQGERGRR